MYTPDDLATGETRSAVLLCHGYTGVKDLYLPDNAASLNQAGYVAMTFDYKGWGDSEGARSRLAPYSRVADVQAAMTFLGLQPEVAEERIGLYGTSYGGATVSWVGAIDLRAKCIVSVVGVGNGARWMSRVRRVDEWIDLQELSKADREKRAKTGQSQMVERGDILAADRQSMELAAAARRNIPSAVGTIPLEYVDDTMGFNAEWIVDKISPPAHSVHYIGQRPAGLAGRVRAALRPRQGAQEAGGVEGCGPLRSLRRARLHPGDDRDFGLVPGASTASVGAPHAVPLRRNIAARPS